MFVEERKQEILNILKKKERVSVNELSDYFNLSKVIIRRDLCQMEKDGTLERTHGGAILKRKIGEKISFQELSKSELAIKNDFANIIIDNIEEGDIIFFDGSVPTLIASYLLQKRKIDLTVISNSPEIIKILSKNKYIQIISTGGIFNAKNKLFLGEITKNNLELFNLKKIFLEPEGVNLEKGNLSCKNISIGEIKKTACKLAKEIFILANDGVFYQDSVFNFSKIQINMTFIISSTLESSIENLLNSNNIHFLK